MKIQTKFTLIITILLVLLFSTIFIISFARAESKETECVYPSTAVFKEDLSQLIIETCNNKYLIFRVAHIKEQSV